MLSEAEDYYESLKDLLSQSYSLVTPIPESKLKEIWKKDRAKGYEETQDLVTGIVFPTVEQLQLDKYSEESNDLINELLADSCNLG